MYILRNADTGEVVADHVKKAEGALSRMIGLLGKSKLERSEALWLCPCNGVHTIGMKFAIDLAVLDRDFRVVRIVRSLRPGRLELPCTGGYSVIELASGALAAGHIARGSRLALERAPDGE